MSSSQVTHTPTRFPMFFFGLLLVHPWWRIQQWRFRADINMDFPAMEQISTSKNLSAIWGSFEVSGRKRSYNSSQPGFGPAPDHPDPLTTSFDCQALEAAYDRGICRSLGVSNYLKKHLEETHGEGQEISRLMLILVDVGWCWSWSCDIL